MSRRRVSVRDLGSVDCEGWLLHRKEGRSFLGSKWKRFWFVLKRSSLYWYSDQVAEKAEGFIHLSGFTIEQAKQCGKKHAMTASHPLVVTIVIAAESFTDMNKWISKLSEAAERCEPIDAEECYSEGSDQDGDKCAYTSCCLEAEQETAEYESQVCESPSSTSVPKLLSAERRRRSMSDSVVLGANRTGRVADGGGQLSWMDFPEPGGAVGETPPDEMESLYNCLKAVRLSPIGRPSQRDFRASFIRRCHNDQVNNKLHLLRILSSTLKAKELALQALEQILHHPALTPRMYRKWRLSNSILLQEIRQRKQAAGGAAEQRPPENSAAHQNPSSTVC